MKVVTVFILVLCYLRVYQSNSWKMVQLSSFQLPWGCSEKSLGLLERQLSCASSQYATFESFGKLL